MDSETPDFRLYFQTNKFLGKFTNEIMEKRIILSFNSEKEGLRFTGFVS